MNGTSFEDEIRELLLSRQKIEALKRYRARTVAGIAAARTVVEREVSYWWACEVV